MIASDHDAGRALLRERLARLMIHRYGDVAAIRAAMEGMALLAKGDREGLTIWLTISREIDRLQAEPVRPETMH